jgi:hypothetical protein
MRRSRVMLGVAVCLLVTTGLAHATLDGPAWPPPGGVTFWSSGTSAGSPNEATYSFSNFDLASHDLYWGPIAESVKISLDASGPDGGDVLSFSSSTSKVATWTGTEYLGWLSGTDTFTWSLLPVRYTITLIGGAAWINPDTIAEGIEGDAGQVAKVTGNFIAKMHAEALWDEQWWYPTDFIFDNVNEYPGTVSISEMNGGFWSRDVVPEPVTMLGFIIGVGGLARYMRKRRVA